MEQSRRGFLGVLMAAAACQLLPGSADAHPGALNAAGCHRDRRHRSYHCHAGAVKRGAHRRFIGWGGGQHDFSSRHGRRRAQWHRWRRRRR